jgi:hypothetical protein
MLTEHDGIEYDEQITRGGRICPTSYSVFVNRNEIRFEIVKNRSINRFSKLRGKGKDENVKRARRPKFYLALVKRFQSKMDKIEKQAYQLAAKG